jgi:hypothetical protein
MTEQEQKTKKPWQMIPWLDLEFIGLFGVALPAITLAVEFMLHLCAGVYVDPIPSWWHVFAIASVVVANGVGWWYLVKKDLTPRWLPFMVGTSIGVSIFYALVFAPMVPIGVMAIMFMGLGFLPLAPLFAFLCAVRLAFVLRRRRKALTPQLNMRGLWPGAAAGVLLLVMAEAPNMVTQIGLRQAIADQPQVSRAGVRLLRAFGSEQSLLRSCYSHTASVSDIPSLLFARWRVESEQPLIAWHEETRPLTIEQARQIYYRVYGRPFNTVPRPKFQTGLQLFDGDRVIEDELLFWDFDSELAGENVGGRTAGVSLADSAIVTEMNPDVATSYTEWTMVFNNESYAQQEARMQIELPPGGVVSRATLWVNGEPREAAFGEKNLVRQAYQAVVATKRDPLLVSSVGPNKVMLQCFPVPPKNLKTPGQMKVRVGITAPCVVPTAGEANLVLPRIAERGFPVKCKHQVRVESASAITTNLKDAQPASDAGKFRFVSAVDDAGLRDEPVTVHAERDTKLASTYTAQPMSGGKQFVVERLQPMMLEKPERIFVVVDGSAAMKNYLPSIASALGRIPKAVPTQLVFASDEISSLVASKEKQEFAKSLRELTHAPCVGGPDNLHTLWEAWSSAMQNPKSALVWIHGPQPVLFGGTELADRFDPTSHFAPTLYDVEVHPGPNRLVEKLPPSVKVVDVPRLGELKTDIENFLLALTGTSPAPYMVALSTTQDRPAGAHETVAPAVSSQLVSLWAYDQTLKLIADNKPKDAVKLAARQKLVTPVTGAVVLETAADYQRNGIDPNNPDNNATASATPPFSIGAAPEPEEYALMLVALMAVAWQIWRMKSLRRRIA